MKNITSGQNSLFKETRLLKTRKHREETGLFLIEGTRFLEEALGSNADIIRVFFSESFLDNGHRELVKELTGHEAYSVPDRLFKELADTDSPQGVLALVRTSAKKAENVLGGDNLFVVLDSIQDPGNMGTIIRTADAAGFSGVFASKGCVDVHNPKVLRSTMGSIFHIPVIEGMDTGAAVSALKAGGIKVYAAHLGGQKYYFDFYLGKNAAIIIGNEARGIGEETAAMADALLKIPMPGRAESLNASVAAGVLMFESVRQRTAVR